MEQEIKDIIAKSLPAQVGDVLRARLEQADKDAKELAIRRDEAVRNTEARNALDARVMRLEIELKKAGDIKERELQVEARERYLDLEMAKGRAQNAEKSTEQIMSLVSLVFKNTTVRESIFKSENVQVQQPGGYVSQMPQNSNTSITRDYD